MNAIASQNETRVTPWTDCIDGPWHPSLPNGGVAAYRIWQQFNGREWFQRHEWRNADGTTSMDAWINGAKGWNSRAETVEAA